MSALLRSESMPDLIFSELIRAPIGEVYKALTTARLMDDWGGGPARFQARPGGKWSLWDGIMHGVVKDVQNPNRIAFTLREIHWHERDLDSLVSIQLTEIERGTRIELRHSNLPSRKVRQHHEEAWGDVYLGPIKAFLESKFSPFLKTRTGRL
ncbi:MAG: SRPBCC domain-containing protein [Spirochaetia bacterium]|nr:SRPBCC domain-containing protein [Spirochaetia bacterium]